MTQKTITLKISTLIESRIFREMIEEHAAVTLAKRGLRHATKPERERYTLELIVCEDIIKQLDKK